MLRVQLFVLPSPGFNDDDTLSPRAMSLWYGANINKDACLIRCGRLEYSYAGLFSNYCWCSNSLQYNENTSGGCTYKCSDYDSTQYGSCGGVDTISVYTTGSTGTEPDWRGVSHLGCHDTPLHLVVEIEPAMSQAGCILECRQRSYPIAALKGSLQCYCGTGMSGTVQPQAYCESDCSGPQTKQICVNGCGSVFERYDMYSTSCNQSPGCIYSECNVPCGLPPYPTNLYGDTCNTLYG